MIYTKGGVDRCRFYARQREGKLGSKEHKWRGQEATLVEIVGIQVCELENDYFLINYWILLGIIV